MFCIISHQGNALKPQFETTICIYGNGSKRKDNSKCLQRCEATETSYVGAGGNAELFSYSGK